jgi:hypothetical protein
VGPRSDNLCHLRDESLQNSRDVLRVFYGVTHKKYLEIEFLNDKERDENELIFAQPDAATPLAGVERRLPSKTRD